MFVTNFGSFCVVISLRKACRSTSQVVWLQISPRGDLSLPASSSELAFFRFFLCGTFCTKFKMELKLSSHHARMSDRFSDANPKSFQCYDQLTSVNLRMDGHSFVDELFMAETLCYMKMIRS